MKLIVNELLNGDLFFSLEMFTNPSTPPTGTE
jgi:hypothetical protein